ncbi:MAG TPA: HNH endonuclease [Chthoniobacteraceae bacterium]|nr:HNH endonuclease [Chthoniobacteraceae bacterium]
MTWLDAVSEGISRLTERRRSNLFTRQIILDEELASITTALGSSGKTPAQTLSRVLQELRDAGEIEFLGAGEYRLISSRSLAQSTESEYTGSSARIPTVVNRIQRDTMAVRKLKIKYGYRCQLCEERLELRSGFYCEAHHLRPLGSPHGGPDIESNMIIVCPNHHTLLDYAAIPLSRDNLRIDRHEIGESHIGYHNQLYKNNT